VRNIFCDLEGAVKMATAIFAYRNFIRNLTSQLDDTQEILDKLYSQEEADDILFLIEQCK